MNNNGESQIQEIPPDGHFRFACGPQVRCFNECCRDLNQFLTPYDVLRLKHHLKMTSSEFLQSYTHRHEGPETGLPIVTLRPQAGPEKKCPFVSSQGCRVYADRPASCRMYPVARMACRDHQSGQIREASFLFCESHCEGFSAGPLLTVSEWLADQELAPYNAANDSLIELIGIKRRCVPGPLPRDFSDRIFTALYDLDHFRTLLETGRPVGLDLTAYERIIEAGADDEALLKLTIAYAAGCLRNDPA